MNINLSTVTDSPKATKAAVDGSAEVKEESSSEGFFSKLSAFIKGESGEGEKSVKPDVVEAVKTSSETEESAKAVKVNDAENSSADELLSSEDAEVSDQTARSSSKADSNSDTDASLVQTEGDEFASVAKTDSASAKVDSSQVKPESALANDAEQIIADNQEILKRLDQSNSALQSRNGKALPPEDAQEVEAQFLASKAAVVASTSHESLDKSGVSSNAPASAELASRSLAEDAQANDIPEAARPFIQSQSADPRVPQQPIDQIDSLAAGTVTATTVPAQLTTDGELNEEVLQARVDAGQQNGDVNIVLEAEALEQQEVAALQQAANGEHQLSTGNGSKLDEQFLSPEAIAASAATVGAVKSSEADVALDSRVKRDPKNQTQLFDTLSTESAKVGAEVPIAAAAVTAAAIPWAASGDDVVLDDDVVLQSKQPQTQQAVVAQSVHQALTQSQANNMAAATQLNAATTIPAASADAVASQVQAMVNAPVTAATSPVVTEQAMLKAAMAAKAGGNVLNSGGLTSGEAKDGSESGFAQQLAQAAGVQQANSPAGPIRPDQAAQVPLQLNREMASDQVAERIQMMMSKNLKNIDIRLDPPELGRMQIRMNMNGDGATVHFTVANQQARDALEQSMPRLREMLAQQGVQLGDTSVQQQASGQQQSRYADNGQGQAGQPSGRQGEFGEENLEPDINLDLNVAAKRDGISYYA